MTRRLVGLLCIFVSILVLPYWVYLPALFIGIVIFPFFWEGILLVLLINIIHGNNTEFLTTLTSPLSLSMLVMLIVLLPIRDRLRSYV